MAEALPIIASVVGIGSGIRNLTRGGGSGGTNTNAYQPKHQGEVDDAFQQMLQQYMQSQGIEASAITPALQQAFAQMLGVPIGQEYGTLADIAGGFGERLNKQAYTAAGAQSDLMDTGKAVWQSALDPQEALRQRIQQQVTDASRAGTSARGIGMSGESAGIENQDVRDFLMNWQNAQLGRRVAGAGAMTGAYDAAGRQGNAVGQNLTGSINMGALSPQFLEAGSSYPMRAAGAYTGALNPILQQWLALMGTGNQYMGQGTNASNVGGQQQQASLANTIYSLGNLANIYRPTPMGGGGGGGDGYQTDPYATGGYGT